MSEVPDFMNEVQEFLKDEKCERCGGPIKAIAYTTTTFIEETGDYIAQSFWDCYMCGKEHSLGSQPYYRI